MQIEALDRAATGIGSTVVCNKEFKSTKRNALRVTLPVNTECARVSDVAIPRNNVLLSVFTTASSLITGNISRRFGRTYCLHWQGGSKN